MGHQEQSREALLLEAGSRTVRPPVIDPGPIRNTEQLSQRFIEPYCLPTLATFQTYFLRHLSLQSQVALLQIYALYRKFLTKRNLVAEFHQKNVGFTRKTAN